jgi:uncharacterized damage-inducible protein DinB
MKKIYVQAILALICCFSFSQINSGDKKSPDSPFIQTISGELDFVEGRLLSLAEAIPEDKYNWRPAEGVRSVSELFVHFANANYFFVSLMGGQFPEGFDRDAEKNMTKKSDVTEHIKKSIAFAKEFLSKYDIKNIENIEETPIGEMSHRRLIMLFATHGHEHLGQSIAYARMNGITPPWSEKQK